MFRIFLSLIISCIAGFTYAGELTEETSESRPLVSGFFDLQHATPGSGSTSRSAMFLNDSALYLNARSREFSFSADLPVQALSWRELSFIQEKAQLYFDYLPDTHWRSRFGQFDAPFGIEMNDSVDNVLSQQGLVFEDFAPYTHSGWMGSYLSDELEIHGILADIGHVLPRNDKDTGFQSGVQGSIHFSNGFHLSPGILFTQLRDGSFLLSELMLGKNISRWRMDLGADLIRESESPTSKIGLIFLNTFDVSDRSVLALRLESIGSGEESAQVYQVTGGFHHKLKDQITLKGNYTLKSGERSQFLTLSGLYQF